MLISLNTSSKSLKWKIPHLSLNLASQCYNLKAKYGMSDVNFSTMLRLVTINYIIFWGILLHNDHWKWSILWMLSDIVHLYCPLNTSYSKIRYFRMIMSCLEVAKRQRKCWKCWVLSTYHILCVPMIVSYIEVNMQKKRHVQNVGMTSTQNQITRLKHMVLLIRY